MPVLKRSRRFGCISACFAVLSWPVLCAAGARHSQPDSGAAGSTPVVPELEALRAKIAQLEAALAAALQERDRARLDLVTAREELARTRSATAADKQAARAPTPAEPFSAPEALFAEMERRYERDLDVLPRESGPQLEKLRQESQRWVKSLNRSLKGRTTWLVRIEAVREVRSGVHDGLLTVIHEPSMLPIGDPFRVELPARVAERFSAAGPESGGAGTSGAAPAGSGASGTAAPSTAGTAPDRAVPLWEATVIVTAKASYNADRIDAGAFDVPRFVGRYVEFGFDLEWISVVPARRELNVPAGAPGGSTSATPANTPATAAPSSGGPSRSPEAPNPGAPVSSPRVPR